MKIKWEDLTKEEQAKWNKIATEALPNSALVKIVKLQRLANKLKCEEHGYKVADSNLTISGAWLAHLGITHGLSLTSLTTILGEDLVRLIEKEKFAKNS